MKNKLETTSNLFEGKNKKCLKADKEDYCFRRY